MRYFHKTQNKFFCPTINVEGLWTLVSAEVRHTPAPGGTAAPPHSGWATAVPSPLRPCTGLRRWHRTACRRRGVWRGIGAADRRRDVRLGASRARSLPPDGSCRRKWGPPRKCACGAAGDSCGARRWAEAGPWLGSGAAPQLWRRRAGDGAEAALPPPLRPRLGGLARRGPAAPGPCRRRSGGFLPPFLPTIARDERASHPRPTPPLPSSRCVLLRPRRPRR